MSRLKRGHAPQPVEDFELGEYQRGLRDLRKLMPLDTFERQLADWMLGSLELKEKLAEVYALLEAYRE